MTPFPHALLFVLASILTLAVGEARAQEPRLAGPAEPVFTWRTDRCETWDVPDAPARAFRDAGGEVRLIASHWRTRARAGRDLDRATHACRVVFEGAGDDAPAAWDDRLWLTATYTEDGQAVHALAHAEYHGHLRPTVCPAGAYKQCWWNAIVQVVSTDGGRSFRREGTGDRGLVAAPPGRYDPSAGRPVGFFNPSNILRHGNALYAFVFTTGHGAQKAGVCLLRTENIADPKAWRAWDGEGFRVSLAETRPDRPPCAPLAGLSSPIGSVTRIAGTDRFVAVFAAKRALAAGEPPNPGFYAAHSKDLIHWSTPRLVVATPLMWARACTDDAVLAYPALLDPTSEGRNYEDIGRRPYLYATRIAVRDCRLTTERDLIRYPVHLEGLARLDAPGR